MCIFKSFKYSYKPLNAIYLAFARFMSFCVRILNFLVDKVPSRKKLSDKLKLSEKKSFSTHESQLSRKFQMHSFILKRISQQISEDRKVMEESILKDYYDFQEHAFEELKLLQPSMQENLYTFMQEKYSDQNKRTEEILGNLEAMENDFSTLKNQLNALLYNQIGKDTRQHDPDFGIITSILSEAKEDFTKLISENRSKEKKMFQTISRFLQQNQANIREEVMLFSSVVENNETYDGENFKLNLKATLDRMGRMKKNLISTHVFLNQQRSEMEKLQQTVIHFNQNFMYFAVIFDRFWKQNKKASNKASRRLEEIDITCNSLTEKIDTNANLLIRQVKAFARILIDVKNLLTKNNLNLDGVSLSISKNPEERSSEFPNSTETAWINDVDVLNQKLENLLHVNENSKEKLESLKRSSNNFENFHNLMKSMTRSYNTLLRFFLSALERSQKFHCAPKTKLKQREEAIRNIATYDTDNTIRKIVETKENYVGDVSVWDEVRNELDVKLKNVDIENIVFILKDIMKATRKLLDEGQIVPGDIYEADVLKLEDYRQWGDFPSESLLTDVSSEFLVRSSDESTGGLSEVTLEG